MPVRWWRRLGASEMQAMRHHDVCGVYGGFHVFLCFPTICMAFSASFIMVAFFCNDQGLVQLVVESCGMWIAVSLCVVLLLYVVTPGTLGTGERKHVWYRRHFFPRLAVALFVIKIVCTCGCDGCLLSSSARCHRFSKLCFHASRGMFSVGRDRGDPQSGR
jgi:hypothetical protein